MKHFIILSMLLFLSANSFAQADVIAFRQEQFNLSKNKVAL